MSAFGTLRDIVRLLRSHADRVVLQKFALALALVIAGGLLAAAAPLALKRLIDAVAELQTSAEALALASTAIASAAAYIAALCGGRLLTEIRPLVYESAEQRLYGRVSRHFFQRLLDLRLEFHLSRRTGALGQTLSHAVYGCQLLLYHVINSIVPVAVELAAVAVILFTLGQPALVATLLVTAALYLAIFAGSIGPLTRSADELSAASLHTHAVLTDSLLNYETIKYFNAEAPARRRYATATADLENQWAKLNAQRVMVGLAVTATFTISVSVAIFMSARGVADGTLSVGGFVLANLYMMQIVRPLEMVGAAFRDLSHAVGYIRPLLAVLEAPREERSDEDRCEIEVSFAAATESTAPATLSMRDVTFHYSDERPVLQRLNLEIPAGRTVAVVGASGAGKSSLVRLILRLYEPREGQILLDGVPIQDLPLARLRSVIGLVPQDAVLFNDTISYNIGIGKPGATHGEIEHAARLAHLHDFISSLPAGYDTVVGERGLKLSGGERQRIAIARAVIKRPRLYLFDEATSSLDGRTETEILRNLREISASCTTIMIAHRLTTVLHADEIVVLDGGAIAERGTHASLLASHGIYATLWRAQLPRVAA